MLGSVMEYARSVPSAACVVRPVLGTLMRGLLSPQTRQRPSSPSPNLQTSGILCRRQIPGNLVRDILNQISKDIVS